MSSLVGKQLGDYTLVGVLATGGMARIYEGVDRKLGRQAAIKVLELAQAGDEEVEALMQRFQREARAVAQLEHDNIITIYQYGEQDGLYFIAMKLIRGRDLAQELARLRRNGMRMDVRRALRILEQVAAALDCAHEAQIIHRDVKPSNILLDNTDRATLTDFGLVMQPAVDATLGTAFGTPRYIAPEQALSSGSAVAASDTYALAVIMYEILTGQTPFDGSTPMEIALSHINDAPPPPRSINSAIPEAAERELLRALDKEPTNRPATASEFVANVKRAYDPEGVHEASTELSSKTTLMPDLSPQAAMDSWDAPPAAAAASSRAKVNPVLLIGAGVIVVLLIVVAALLASRSQSPVADIPASPTAVVVVATAVEPTIAAALPKPTEVTEQPIAAALTAETTAETTTEPTEPPTATATATTLPSVLLLTYSDSAFSVTNVGSIDLDVRTIQFARGADVFIGTRIPTGKLAAGACFRLLLQGRQSEQRPGECDTLGGQTFLPDPTHFFWRTEPENIPTFDVLFDTDIIMTCPTVARSQSTTCSVTLTPSA